MSKLQKLEELVRQLYQGKDPNRDGWADWLYVNHVLWVADKAEELAKRFNVDPEGCRAVALLHDISDTKIAREDESSEELSLTMARDLLLRSGYDEAEVSKLVDDAIRYHSCRDSESPQSDEGKILATADALAHFQTDFYLHAFSQKLFGQYDTLKQWSAKKIEKDFNNKIMYDEIREEVRPQYETFKLLFR